MQRTISPEYRRVKKTKGTHQLVIVLDIVAIAQK